MSGSAEDLGFEKKTVCWDLNSEWACWDSSLEEGSRFLVSPRRDQLGSTKCAARLLKKFCLSLLMSKNLTLKKVNKSFVPEPISYFSDFYMGMNICERFHIRMNMSTSRLRILVVYFWTWIYNTKIWNQNPNKTNNKQNLSNTTRTLCLFVCLFVFVLFSSIFFELKNTLGKVSSF